MPQHPNVVVFLTDQQRHDSTGVHGNPLGLTPHFDRIAARATHLYHCFTPQPVCGPARACLQTGKYATANGCWRNGIALPAQEQTLAHRFNEAGYRTAYIGKWHLAAPEVRGAVSTAERGGYDYWLAANCVELISDPYDCVLFDNDDQPVRLPGYRADATTDAAIRYLGQAAQGDDPFFLFLSLLEPHHQNRLYDYVPPQGYRDPFAGRWMPPDLAALGGQAHAQLPGYWGAVKRVDECFGRLLDALKSLKLDRETIVLFASDHGCHFETRIGQDKRSPHEASIRVPALFSGPGFESGGQVRQLVSLLDLPPTLLEACGLPVPDSMQGRSVMPLLRGGDASWPQDVLVQISESHIGRALRTHRWKYAIREAGEVPFWSGVRAPAADRYVESELYDLQSDPWELTNLIGATSHRELSSLLRNRLTDRMVAAGEAPPVIDLAPERRIGPRSVLAEELTQ